MERLVGKVHRMLFYHLSTCSLIWGTIGVVLCRAQGPVATQDERELLNTPASLRCSVQTDQEILTVTWQKMKATSPENMVTYSKSHGVVVQPAYEGRVNITHLGLRNSTLTFWNTTLEDEGCYMCLFNTFGSGKIAGKACLTLYVQPTVSLYYKYFEDHLNITCTATARPAPLIFWKVAGSGIENSTESVSHPNGTTSVTSVLQVKDPETQVGKEVICKVLHLGTVTDFRRTMNKAPPSTVSTKFQPSYISITIAISIVLPLITGRIILLVIYCIRKKTSGYWFSVPLLLSIVSLVILLVLISILLYWKRRRNQDQGDSSHHYFLGSSMRF